MKCWIGKSIMFIGAVHSAFGFIGFRQTLAELLREGLINTVNGQPKREFAFWFILFGLFAILFGAFVDWCERSGFKLPSFLGWGLLVMTLIVITIMPISGGWLLLAPSIGAILYNVPRKPDRELR